VAGAADDDGLEALHRFDSKSGRRAAPASVERLRLRGAAGRALVDAHADVFRAVAEAPHRTAHRRRVIVRVAGQIGRIRVRGRTEVLLGTAACDRDADAGEQRADGEKPLHTSDDGRPVVSLSSKCAPPPHPGPPALTAITPSPTLKASCGA